MDDDGYGWYNNLFLKYPDITYEQTVEESERHYNFQSLDRKQQVYEIISRIGNFGTFNKWNWYEKDIKRLERDYKDIIAIRPGFYYARARLYTKQGKYEHALDDYLLLEKEYYAKGHTYKNPHAGITNMYFYTLEMIVLCLCYLRRSEEAEARLNQVKKYYQDQIDWDKKHDPVTAGNSELNYKRFLEKAEKARQGQQVDF